MREFGEAAETRDVSPMLQPAPDGSVLTGTSREPSFAADPYDLDVPRIGGPQASRLVPALAEAPVLSTWSGVRPVSPDERPMLGWVREGLFVATGHGSEGVILGGQRRARPQRCSWARAARSTPRRSTLTGSSSERGPGAGNGPGRFTPWSEPARLLGMPARQAAAGRPYTTSHHTVVNRIWSAAALQCPSPPR